MIEITYVLSEKTARSLHKSINIIPKREQYVGLFCQKKYTSFVTKIQSDIIFSISEEIYRLSLNKDILQISADDEGNLLDFITNYFLSKSVVLDGIEKQYYQGFILYYPIYKGEYIYESDNNNFINNLDDVFEKSVLSYSQIALEYDNQISILQHGVVMYNPSLYLGAEMLENNKQAVESYVKENEMDGLYITDDCPISLEISLIWNLKKILKPGKSKYYGICKFWMDESVRRINQNKTPLFRMYGTDEKAAEMAYEEVKYENEWLISENVNANDGIITVPVISPQDVEIFQKHYNLYSKSKVYNSVKKVLKNKNKIPGVIEGNKVTFHGEEYIIENLNKEKWENGEYLSPWEGYMLTN